MQVARAVPRRLHRAAGHCRDVTASARVKPAPAPQSLGLMVVDGALLLFVCETLNQVGGKELSLEKALAPMALGGLMFPLYARIDAFFSMMHKPVVSALGKRILLINAMYISLPLAFDEIIQSQTIAEVGPARMAYKTTFGALIGVSTFLGVWGSFFAAHSIPRSIARRICSAVACDAAWKTVRPPNEPRILYPTP
ncbi:hypothetical protein SDRG_05475 [Saprolegnia diclina VS20]|uniref:Uncharacterized protein n=1 Tax=Saprolegnia diclina (strain VS20) TaxID=1156394 RepID=T0QR74_SAPDV|nr:hypothetical protein SDRG_05475 [Saprolegnia diclina VS20]EQC37251.1 hypothetical protein SDRG_05475 [Saprolegnia diclina VS20]|eukprot:XP_008609413.1 hypothetical protein SDRG_05475 [Saprolegnia diclina VS20]